jgi:hypothetical protein
MFPIWSLMAYQDWWNEMACMYVTQWILTAALWQQSIPVLLNFTLQHYSDSHGRDSAVGTLTTLQATQSGVWIPAEACDFSPLQNLQTNCGAHPSCLVGTGGKLTGGVKLITFLHLLPRLGMSGAITLLLNLPLWHEQRQLYLFIVKAVKLIHSYELRDGI